MGSLANQKLPIINFSKENLEVGSSSWLSTSKEVVVALEEFGCFMATYTDFSPELHHATLKASKEMFDLPTHILNTPSSGYIKQNPTVALYEAFKIEYANTEQGVDNFTNLLWPSGNNFIRETALEYTKVVAELDQVVMRMVCEVYGIKKSYESVRESIMYRLRLLKYRAPTKDETNIGFIPHTDKCFMTILQQYEKTGLVVQTKNGDWISVDTSPSTFMVMAGDTCMAWTNRRIEAPWHKVVIEHGSEERYAVGVFIFMEKDEIKVAEEMVDEDHPLQFKPFNNDKYITFLATEEGRRAKCTLAAFCGV